MRIEQESDIDAAVDDFYDVVPRAASTACEYYTLYYLVEVEDVASLSFPFKQMSTKLRDTLHNYAVYVATMEAFHNKTHLMFDDFVMGNFNKSRATKVTQDQMQYVPQFDDPVEYENHIREKITEILRIELKDDEAELARRFLLGRMGEPTKPSDKDGIINYCSSIEKRLNAFTKSKRWLNVLEFIFGHNWRDEPASSGRAGWQHQYGGKAWASVARAANRIDELPTNSFVDMMFSIEHNNGNFMDKIGYDKNNENDMFKNAAERAGMQVPIDITKSRYYDNVMQGVLNMARQEHIKGMWMVAVQRNRELRQYEGLLPDNNWKVGLENSLPYTNTRKVDTPSNNGP